MSKFRLTWSGFVACWRAVGVGFADGMEKALRSLGDQWWLLPAALTMTIISIVAGIFGMAQALLGAPEDRRAVVERAALEWVGEGGRLRGCGYLASPTRCDVVSAAGLDYALDCYWSEASCERVVERPAGRVIYSPAP